MEAVSRGRQALSVLAVGSLFVPLAGAFTPSAGQPPLVTFLFATGFVAVLVIAVLVVSTTDVRRLAKLDVAALATGVLVACAEYIDSAGPRGTSDVTALNKLALASLMRGHNPYTQIYAQVGANGGGTPLLTGGSANTYGYPPFTLEVGRALGVISGPLASPSIVALLGVIGLAIGLFVALPPEWRPLAVIGVFGFGIEMSQALSGSPVVLACALLAVPMYRWTATGRGGRLGVGGVVRAVCLGLAAASQQLTWFVLLFLVIGLSLVRLGELPTRRALAVVARYTVIAAATFVAVNLPFLVDNAAVWAQRMGETLTQQAIVFGSSWTLPVLEMRGGSDRLALLTYSTAILALALLIGYAAGFRRMAPAVAILPSLLFVLSTRSNSEYFESFVPLWVVAVMGADRAEVAAARVLRLAVPRVRGVTASRLLTSRRLTIAITAGLLTGALALYELGLSGRAPVALHPLHLQVNGSRVSAVTVDVTNNSDRTVRPQYYVDQRIAINDPWRVTIGPESLQPHQRARLTLRPWTTLEPASYEPHLWIFATVAAAGGVSAGFTARSLNDNPTPANAPHEPSPSNAPSAEATNTPGAHVQASPTKVRQRTARPEVSEARGEG
jgi:hypothetical protein